MQFIAKEMFTRFAVIYRQRDVYLQNRLDHSFFKLPWYSNLFADFITWKENSEFLRMQHENAYTSEKKEQTFSSLDQLWFCMCVLIFSSFPSLLPLYFSQTGYYFTSNLNKVRICVKKCCTSFQTYSAFRRPTSAKFKPPQQNSPSCLCSAASFASLLSSNAWFAISSLARFEVITKIASLHTIVFPCPSVKRPWIKNRGFFSSLLKKKANNKMKNFSNLVWLKLKKKTIFTQI